MSQRVAERRRRTTDEIVSAAVDVMTETGAAGLSLGEVAARMGMRTPSLYGYFDSRAALCDEIFRRGWLDLSEVMQPHYRSAAEASPALLRDRMVEAMEAFVGWAVANRAPAELMFWRPVAAWEPSVDAYAAAEALVEQLGASVVGMQDAGLLDSDAPVPEMAGVLMVMSAGVITQHLANEPGVELRSGRHASLVGALVDTFLSRYGAHHAGN